jgi:DNA replication licensing factor MCM7
MRIIARGPVTRQCSPGDIVQITGIYMPTPSTGFQAFKTGLNHDVHIEAYNITKDKQNFKEYMLSDEMMNKVKDVVNTCENEQALFQRVSCSICPEIFGMEEIK